MRAEDPWLVMRYAPLLIDGHVYFPIAVPMPAGNWRRDRIGQGVTYVDPRTGAEFTREKTDMLERAGFAPVEKVQELLEYLRPGQYKAVSIRCRNDGVHNITLIMNGYVSKGIGARLGLQRVPGLTGADQDLIAEFSGREASNELQGSIAVAARLIEARGATRFIRLAKILAETIWSV